MPNAFFFFFRFVITALGAEKLVHHVFCHDLAAQQVVLHRSSVFSEFIIQSRSTCGVCLPSGEIAARDAQV